MRPYLCGNVCSCCDMFGCSTVDAIDYYTDEESRLQAQVCSNFTLSSTFLFFRIWIFMVSTKLKSREFKFYSGKVNKRSGAESQETYKKNYANWSFNLIWFIFDCWVKVCMMLLQNQWLLSKLTGKYFLWFLIL